MNKEKRQKAEYENRQDINALCCGDLRDRIGFLSDLNWPLANNLSSVAVMLNGHCIHG